VQVEIGDLVELHGLAVLGQLQVADEQPDSLESLQVHVKEGTADPDFAGQVADVVTAAGQLGHDP
jgi:hypothetical protein